MNCGCPNSGYGVKHTSECYEAKLADCSIEIFNLESELKRLRSLEPSPPNLTRAGMYESDEARAAPKGRECYATAYADPPQDCDAPFCGCNPAWTDCIRMLQECNLLVDRRSLPPSGHPVPKVDWEIVEDALREIAGYLGPLDSTAELMRACAREALAAVRSAETKNVNRAGDNTMHTAPGGSGAETAPHGSPSDETSACLCTTLLHGRCVLCGKLVPAID